MGCSESSQHVAPAKNDKMNRKIELKAITEENTSQIEEERVSVGEGNKNYESTKKKA